MTKFNEYCGDYYWQSEEDEQNPVKILYNNPKKLLDDCIYAVTGNWHGAAITSDGELYTWGLNIYGECGAEITEDDYVRIPVKVLDNVNMVWVERIDCRGTEEHIIDNSVRATGYDFNLFIQLNDGTVMAAGKDLGKKQKTIEVTGDLICPSTDFYSDKFVPIVLEEYSEEYCRAKINELQWGMTLSEAEEILDQGKIEYLETLFPREGAENELTVQLISVNDDSYVLHFDEDQHLDQIKMQVGGSRNGQFSLGMTLEEVQALLDCELSEEPDVYAQNELYWTSEPIDGTYIGFVFDNTENVLMLLIEAESPTVKETES